MVYHFSPSAQTPVDECLWFMFVLVGLHVLFLNSSTDLIFELTMFCVWFHFFYKFPALADVCSDCFIPLSIDVNWC